MERSHWVLAGPTDSSKIDSTKNLSPLYSCIEAGENRRVLYHYTSVESLLKIVAPAMFKFSRIDRVNDPIEKRALLHEDFYKAAYIACFNHDENESIPLWKMYTPKGQGVRVGFYFKGPNIQNNFLDLSRSALDSNKVEVDWLSLLDLGRMGTARLMIKDVLYSDKGFDLGSLTVKDEKIEVMIDYVGAFKSSIWDYERETRMVLYFLDEDKAKELDADYLLLPINTNYIDKVEVRFDPWMSEELKRCLELGLDEYASKWGIRIIFANSELVNRIK